MSFILAEQGLDWFVTLPPRTRNHVRSHCVERFMQAVEWPSGEGFGSSDGWAALRWVLTEESDEQIKKWEAEAQLEAKLLDTPGFDWDRAAEMFAPRVVR